MQRAPADYDPSHEPECTGYYVPIIDALVAAGGTVLAIGTAQGWAMDSGKGGMEVAFAIVIGVVFALIPACSSITGFVWSGTCQDAHDKHEVWLSNLTEEELQVWKSEKYLKECRKLKKKHERLPTSASRRLYYSKCREFIREERQKDSGGKK